MEHFSGHFSRPNSHSQLQIYETILRTNPYNKMDTAREELLECCPEVPSHQEVNGEEDEESELKPEVGDPDEQVKKKKKKKKKKKAASEDNDQAVEVPEPVDGVVDKEDEGEGEGEEGSSEKKKKKRKKKKGGGGGAEAVLPQRNPNGMLLLYDGSYAEPTEVRPSKAQTFPPTVPVDELFPGGRYPTGQEMPYKDDHTSASRLTSEEKRALERDQTHVYSDVRRAAEAHRHVRKYMQSVIRPGMKMIEICETLEDCSRRMIREQGLDAGESQKEGAGREGRG